MTVKHPSRRQVAAGAAVVVVAAGGAVLYMRHGAAASTQYRTAVATIGTVEQTLSLSGNLEPLNATNLNFISSGTVTAVDVQAGQSVTAGQVLATIDPSNLQAALDQAQASLASAEAKVAEDQAGPTAQSLQQSEGQVNTAQVNLQNAQTSLTDTKNINDASVSSGKETAAQAQQADDQAQAQVTSAQVQLQNAQAALAALKQGTSPQQLQMDQSQVQIAQVNLTNAQQALAGASLTAPTAGVVGEVNLTVGQSVTGSRAGTSSSSGSSSSSSTPEVELITPGAFQVNASVSDTQVNDIAVGQRALVTPAGETQAVSGKVTQIAPVATVSSGVATFPVTITLDGLNPSFHSGVSSTVTVITNELVGVLTVPTSAVRGSSVQVLVNGRPQTRVVTVGASDATHTQILSGLNPGDSVVIATVSSSVPSSTSNRTGGGGLLGGSGPRVIGGGGGGGRVFAGG